MSLEYSIVCPDERMTTRVCVAVAQLTPVMLTGSPEKDRGRREADSRTADSPRALAADILRSSRRQWLIEDVGARQKIRSLGTK
jgi:hypothetical protein